MQIDLIDCNNFLQQEDFINSWASFPKNLQILLDDKLFHNVSFEDISLEKCYKMYFGFVAEYILSNLCSLAFEANNIGLDSKDFEKSLGKIYGKAEIESLKSLQDFISKRDLSFIENIFIELIFVDDESIRELNREYLQKDYSTDVLSFPLYVMPFCEMPYILKNNNFNISMFPICSSNYKQRNKLGVLDSKLKISNQPLECLGSIVVNTKEALNQSNLLGHNVHAEICILFVHALLHLLGFNHESDCGEQRRLERTIIESLQLPYGLIERALVDFRNDCL